MKYFIGGLVGVAAASVVWYILWMMHANKMKKAAEEKQKEIDRLKALIPATSTPAPAPAPVIVAGPTGTTATPGATATPGTTAQRMFVNY